MAEQRITDEEVELLLAGGTSLHGDHARRVLTDLQDARLEIKRLVVGMEGKPEELRRLRAENTRLREAMELIAEGSTISDAVPEIRHIARAALAPPGGRHGD